MSLMTTTSVENPVTSKPRRPRSANGRKGTSRQGRQGDSKPKKVSFYLSDAAIERLGIAATMERTDKSRVVEALIAEHLKRWRVQDLAKPSDQAAGATQEVSA